MLPIGRQKIGDFARAEKKEGIAMKCDIDKPTAVPGSKGSISYSIFLRRSKFKLFVLGVVTVFLATEVLAGFNAPTNLTATQVLSNSVSLSWSDNSTNEMNYVIERSVQSLSSGFTDIATLPANTRNYTDNTVAPGTTSYYRVSAIARKGNRATSSPISVTTPTAVLDTTPPSTPNGFVATASSCNQINLSWSASTDSGGSGLKGYNVYRNGALLKQVLAPATSTSDTGLSAQTNYSYAVSAVDNAGNQSAQSTPASATTLACPDTTPPSVPTGLAATASSCSQINLSWSASTDSGGSGLKGYNVYRNGALLKQVLAPATSTSDTGLSAQTNYSYRVSAVDNAGNQSAQGTASSATTLACPDTTPPSAPTGLTAAASSCSQINLSWSASTDSGGSGLKGYNIYRNGTFLKQVLAPATSTSDTGLSAQTGYSYTASAVDNAGNQSAQSTAASATTPSCTDTTPPSMPLGVFATAVSSSQINLSWSPSTDTGGSGLAGYNVYRGGVLIGGTTLTSHSNTGLTANTQYCYTVAAYDHAGNVSGQSAQACSTTPSSLPPTGAHLWSYNFGGTGSTDSAITTSVAVDGSGNVVVTGYFLGVADFGGAPLVSLGGQDIFVAKFSATGVHLWSQRFGSAANDYGYAVVVDSSGNIVVTGSFIGTVGFGGGSLTSVGSGFSDIFIAKYSPTGSHLWSKRFGDTGNDRSADIAVDSNGNIVVTGAFVGAVDFGGGALTSVSGTNDIFVAKYTSAGAHVWSKSFGSTGDDRGNGVAVDSSGNVVVTGYFTNAVDFGGGALPNAGLKDIFLAKYSAAGTHVWSERFGGISQESGNAVGIDNSGNIVMTGHFYGTVDFGGGPLSKPSAADVFLAKYAPDGSHQWSKVFGGTIASDNAVGMSVAVDGGGNVAITGYFQGSADFGGGTLTSVASQDMFLAKYASDGSHMWSRRFGGVSLDQGTALAIDASNNIVTTGYFNYDLDFGGGNLTSVGGSDLFIAKFGP